VYDRGLNGELRAAGVRAGVEVLLAAISGCGSDASIAIAVLPGGPRRLFGLPHPEHPRDRDCSPRGRSTMAIVSSKPTVTSFGTIRKKTFAK